MGDGVVVVVEVGCGVVLDNGGSMETVCMDDSDDSTELVVLVSGDDSFLGGFCKK